MKQPKQIRFTDNKGKQIELPAKMTIEEMVKVGINFEVARKGEPLKDGWYRSDGETEKVKP